MPAVLPFVLFGIEFIVVTIIIRRRSSQLPSSPSLSGRTYGIAVIVIVLAATAGRFVASRVADAIILLQAIGANNYLHSGIWVRFVYRHEIVLSNGTILGTDSSRLYDGVF